MHCDFRKPTLSREQKSRIKALYRRDNYHGLQAISVDMLWIAASVSMVEMCGSWLLPIAIVLIGSRQRALASLLHEAAHGTLFAKKFLNSTVGRVICGWLILQSFSAYRSSHVHNHHPKVGEAKDDPDLKFMLQMGVYEPSTRSGFIWKFLIAPVIGLRTPAYLWFVLRDRLLGNLLDTRFRAETLALICLHFACVCLAAYGSWLPELLLYWYVPYLTAFGVIGWLSELAEHYPMMNSKLAGSIYEARNRYAAWPERLIIGMHGDHFHLTHHLLPGIPHWNLHAATSILREDPAFLAWDNLWGGIFTAQDDGKVSMIKFVVNLQSFEPTTKTNVELAEVLA